MGVNDVASSEKACTLHGILMRVVLHLAAGCTWERAVRCCPGCARKVSRTRVGIEVVSCYLTPFPNYAVKLVIFVPRLLNVGDIKWKSVLQD